MERVLGGDFLLGKGCGFGFGLAMGARRAIERGTKFAIGAVVVGRMDGLRGRDGLVRVRFVGGKRFGFSGLGGFLGFGCEFFAKGADALVVFDGAAVETVGLGLVAEELGEGG